MVAMTANPDDAALSAAKASTPRTGRIPADTFSNRLVLARRLAGMTIEEAAAAAGLNRSSWANWENGRRPQGQVDVCQAIANALDVDFNWLLLGGALEPARGRPTKRVISDTSGYPLGPDKPMRASSVRPADTRPKVRADSRASIPAGTAGRRAVPVR
jgi:transcriptional regulator with XRE-family HTH domain